MHRFHHQISLEGKDSFTLKDPNVAHQIGRVLRMKVGDQIAIFNGSGIDYICEITEIDKRLVSCNVLSQNKPDTERSLYVHIYQAVPHTWSKFEDVLKKCTEVGASDFYPLIMGRCETKLKDGEEPPKEDRLSKIIIEACEQCGASVLPKLHNVVSLASATQSAPGIKIMAYEGESHRSLEDLVSNIKQAGEVSLFIGPEGGITEEEAEFFRSHGGFTFHLGKRILRTETAPVAVLSRLVI